MVEAVKMEKEVLQSALDFRWTTRASFWRTSGTVWGSALGDKHTTTEDWRPVSFPIFGGWQSRDKLRKLWAETIVRFTDSSKFIHVDLHVSLAVSKSYAVDANIEMCHCWRMLVVQLAWRLVSVIDIGHHSCRICTWNAKRVATNVLTWNAIEVHPKSNRHLEMSTLEVIIHWLQLAIPIIEVVVLIYIFMYA